MIDYFMVPFAAPNDNEAMAGIAHEVNREESQGAIQQAPHHFELYSLGEIDDNGIIFPKKELVCDCSSLVRARRQSAESEAGMASGATRAHRGANQGTGGNAGSDT